MRPNRPPWTYLLSDLWWRSRRIVTGQRVPLNRDEGYRPFFIVGSGRSGNTLMRRVLQTSPELHIPPETFVLGDCIESGGAALWPRVGRGIVNRPVHHYGGVILAVKVSTDPA